MSEKLAALEAAQERVRVAEARVAVIRDLEAALESGELMRSRAGFIGIVGTPVPLSPFSLKKTEVSALTEGLLLARRNALADVEQKKAIVEGMLK